MSSHESSSASQTGISLALPEWLGQLASLEMRAVEVEVTFAKPVELRDPACAVVRGLLGERLRDIARPVYDAWFEGDSAEVRADSLPPPYWLAGVPADPRIPAGTTLAARLFAAGPAANDLPYFDVALRDALGRLGRGGPSKPESHPRLGPSRTTRVELPPFGPPATTLRIEASTPLLLRGDSEACSAMCPGAPEIALLARAGVRRLDALLAAFGPPAAIPRVAFPDLRALEVASGGLVPWRGSRFSRRQGQRFPLEGLAGSISIRGAAVAELARLFHVLAKTSVGKATTMGFGVLVAAPA